MQELQNPIRPIAQSPSSMPFSHCPFRRYVDDALSEWSGCQNWLTCMFLTSGESVPGETKRKFESVYAGGTMDTPESGKVFQYWHCCGSEDPFDPGCTAAPHASYDD
ncbi:hypothetical protein Golax_016174 [Gossypium laxum]|uniref:Uncharacterized protein n=1 Tax=Gossypium laxum TaxID=34288 RepID=A0A7J8YX16_9ROSI|nr:hypothetical protein [Gossypium laxum]